MDVTVEIRPNIGEKNDPKVGIVKQVNDHHSIIVTTDGMGAVGRKGMEVGLVSLVPGRPINLLPPINRFPAAVQEAIVAATKDHLKAIAADAVSESTGDAELHAKASENAQKEASVDRKVFFPPSDQEMTADPPSPSVIVDAAGKPVNQDDIDAFTS